MNDKVETATEADELEQNQGSAAPSGADTPKTAGSALRMLREERGVDLPQLAAVLKVRPEKLAALEADHYDRLPDMVFTRALALSICRLFEVDAAPILALLPDATAPNLGSDSQGLNHSFKASKSDHSLSSGSAVGFRFNYVVALVVLLLVAAGCMYFWPQISSISGQENEPEAVADAQEPVSGVASGELVFPVAAPTTTTPNGATPSLQNGDEMVSVPLNVGQNIQPADESETEMEEAAESALPQESQAIEPETLKIVAKEAVWIQVRDGANVLLKQATLPKGQEFVLTQAPPLRVEIGRVDGVDVYVKGELFDLTPYARANVARFTIEP